MSEPKPTVWRCQECNRPMACQVCGETQGVFIGAEGPVCFAHLPPPMPRVTLESRIESGFLRRPLVELLEASG